MSGHNRWTKIKRKKEAMGASKGALFTKLIREVTVAARNGGGDPDHNARLRSAVLAAREANMPNDTIARAVKKGTGELEGVAYEEMTYEGYGPAGVALVVEVLTDNKNRTAGDVRAIFAKAGGAMGAHGSVAFQFDRNHTLCIFCQFACEDARAGANFEDRIVWRDLSSLDDSIQDYAINEKVLSERLIGTHIMRSQ